MAWDRLSPVQVHSRLSSSWGWGASWAICLAPLASLTLTVPPPIPHFSGYLFFCCYPYQEKNLTNLAYQADVLSRLRCDLVQNSSSVFTRKHSQWTRRQWKVYTMYHGDRKTLRSRQIGRSLTKQVPIPYQNALFFFFIWTVLSLQNIWDSLGYAQEYPHY